MKKVLVMLAEGFETIEALSVVDILKRAQITCDTCAILNKEVKSAHGVTVIADKHLNDDDLHSYDAIVLPGGMPGSLNLKNNILVTELIKEYNSYGKIVAAICAAPIVLAEAKIINGRKITSYPGFENELEHSIYVNDQDVVVDENLITSRGPATALKFGLEILKKLGYEKEADEIKKGMLI